MNAPLIKLLLAASLSLGLSAHANEVALTARQRLEESKASSDTWRVATNLAIVGAVTGIAVAEQQHRVEGPISFCAQAAPWLGDNTPQVINRLVQAAQDRELEVSNDQQRAEAAGENIASRFQGPAQGGRDLTKQNVAQGVWLILNSVRRLKGDTLAAALEADKSLLVSFSDALADLSLYGYPVVIARSAMQPDPADGAMKSVGKACIVPAVALINNIVQTALFNKINEFVKSQFPSADQMTERRVVRFLLVAICKVVVPVVAYKLEAQDVAATSVVCDGILSLLNQFIAEIQGQAWARAVEQADAALTLQAGEIEDGAGMSTVIDEQVVVGESTGDVVVEEQVTVAV